jgi:hypothetical protein
MGSKVKSFSALHWYYQPKNALEPWTDLPALTGEGVSHICTQWGTKLVEAAATDLRRPALAEELDDFCKWFRRNRSGGSQLEPDKADDIRPGGETQGLRQQHMVAAAFGEPLNTRHFIATVLKGQAPPISIHQRKPDVGSAKPETPRGHVIAAYGTSCPAPLPIGSKRTACLCECGAQKHNPQSDDVKGVFEQVIARGSDPSRPERETLVQLWRHNVMVSCALEDSRAAEDPGFCSGVYHPDISKLDLQPSQDSLTRCWQEIHAAVDGTYHEVFLNERSYMIGKAAEFMECMMNAMQCGERLNAHSQVFFQARVWERFRQYASMIVHKKMVDEVPNYIWMGTAPTMTDPPHYAVYRPLEGLCREWLEETGQEKRLVRFDFDGREGDAVVEKWLKRKGVDVRAVVQAERCAAKFTITA